MYVIFKKCYIDMNVGYKEPEQTDVEIKTNFGIQNKLGRHNNTLILLLLPMFHILASSGQS